MPGPEVPLSDLELHKFDLAYKMALLSVKRELDTQTEIRHKTDGIIAFAALFQALEEIFPIVLSKGTKVQGKLRDFALREVQRRYADGFIDVSENNLPDAINQTLRIIRLALDDELKKGRITEQELSKAQTLLQHIEAKVSAEDWPPRG